MYVEGYIAAGRDDVVKSIFGRCLLTLPDLGLWRCYLAFIRKSRGSEGPEGREDVRKAFEFALAHIGEQRSLPRTASPTSADTWQQGWTWERGPSGWTTLPFSKLLP